MEGLFCYFLRSLENRWTIFVFTAILLKFPIPICFLFRFGQVRIFVLVNTK